MTGAALARGMLVGAYPYGRLTVGGKAASSGELSVLGVKGGFVCVFRGRIKYQIRSN